MVDDQLVQPPGQAAAPWTEEACEFVRNRQEDEYQTLAGKLNLGNDPKKAYEKLSGPVMPIDYVSADKFIEAFGDAGVLLGEHARAYAHASITKMYQHYWSLALPTEYESQDRYSSMMLTFESLRNALNKKACCLDAIPLLASLPTGDVNARVLAVPSTGCPVLFFEQGLFRFFHDFAKALSWAFPPISPLQMYDDKAIRQMRTRYTMPEQASRDFTVVLGSYVSEGSTTGISHLINVAPYNRLLAGGLLQAMEWFIMGHELAHLVLGHLEPSNLTDNRDELWEREYEADLFSVELLIEIAKSDGADWAFNFWACDVALTLFICLYRAIALLEFGPNEPRWVSRTHPDPASRRLRLRQAVQNEKYSWQGRLRSGLGMGTAAGALCGMSNALLQRLYEMMALEFLIAHQRKVRPSPIWKNVVAHTFAPKE
jgi:hypothetical protein